MESTVTIPLEEYRRLKGIDEQFDDQIKAARANAETTAKMDVLRDRDTYVRENEKLRNENSKLRDSAAESAGLNVKLRNELARTEKAMSLLKIGLDKTTGEIKKRDENEKTLRETVTRLREERAEALTQRDALLARGLFARIFNRRCW